ncbi:MAG: polyhydroxyalkanoic acid system family protein [Polyangiaceae bacterium]
MPRRLMDARFSGMDHKVPHDIGRDLAKKATDAAFHSYKAKYEKYQPTMSWTGPYAAKVGFTVTGMSLSGTIEVRDKDVALNLDVPLLLRPFKKVAIDIIEKEIEAWVKKAKAGELK